MRGLAKVLEVRTNDCFAELWVNGEFVVGTVDMEMVSHLPRLAHKLGVEFSLKRGDWTREQVFVPSTTTLEQEMRELHKSRRG